MMTKERNENNGWQRKEKEDMHWVWEEWGAIPRDRSRNPSSKLVTVVFIFHFLLSSGNTLMTCKRRLDHGTKKVVCMVS